MKWIVTPLIALVLVLQYKVWVGPGSMAEVNRLSSAIQAQQDQNEKLKERNAALKAEVSDLKQGLEAIEERARSELGMIQRGETFFQIIHE